MLPVPAAGMLKVEGLLPRRCRMFDTPGVPHPFQLHARLRPEEVNRPSIGAPQRSKPSTTPPTTRIPAAFEQAHLRPAAFEQADLRPAAFEQALPFLRGINHF